MCFFPWLRNFAAMQHMDLPWLRGRAETAVRLELIRAAVDLRPSRQLCEFVVNVLFESQKLLS